MDTLHSGVFNILFEYYYCLKINYIFFAKLIIIFLGKKWISTKIELVLNLALLVLVISRIIIFILTGPKIILFISLSGKINHFFIF